jgi:hypothetical protein
VTWRYGPMGNAVTTAVEKPALVYFQRKIATERLVKFVGLHYAQQVAALSRFFTVTVVNQDCDYDEVCDRHRPDVTLFESGLSCDGYQRLSIANTSAHPHVPKLGFFNADSFCKGRAAFLSDMDLWGVEAVFSMSTTLAEYLPDLSDRLFYWPNFIDPAVYRNYESYKVIPVVFTGSTASFYPWRRSIQKIVAAAYPSLLSPHTGYHRRSEERVVWGESYARMLNAAWFAPACGMVAKEVVRKHFEIPACHTCLVTEKTPGLEAAGFVDMHNCVFAEPGDVLDKLDSLMRDPERLLAITGRGHDLVHARHTLAHRDEIFQWLQLRKGLQPGQRIIQENPFGRLRAVDQASQMRTGHLPLSADDRVLLRKGYAELWNGNVDLAMSLFTRCLNTIREIPVPEPQVGLALCHLFKGEAEEALRWLTAPLDMILVKNDTRDPDPVEWAYFIVALLCAGSVRRATHCGDRFPWLRHPELDRARLLLHLLNGQEPHMEAAPRVAGASGGSSATGARISVHQMPLCDTAEWLVRVRRMLGACGQTSLAAKIDAAAASPAGSAC